MAADAIIANDHVLLPWLVGLGGLVAGGAMILECAGLAGFGLAVAIIFAIAAEETHAGAGRFAFAATGVAFGAWAAVTALLFAATGPSDLTATACLALFVTIPWGVFTAFEHGGLLPGGSFTVRP